MWTSSVCGAVSLAVGMAFVFLTRSVPRLAFLRREPFLGLTFVLLIPSPSVATSSRVPHLVPRDARLLQSTSRSSFRRRISYLFWGAGASLISMVLAPSFPAVGSGGCASRLPPSRGATFLVRGEAPVALFLANSSIFARTADHGSFLCSCLDLPASLSGSLLPRLSCAAAVPRRLREHSAFARAAGPARRRTGRKAFRFHCTPVVPGTGRWSWGACGCFGCSRAYAQGAR